MLHVLKSQPNFCKLFSNKNMQYVEGSTAISVNEDLQVFVENGDDSISNNFYLQQNGEIVFARFENATGKNVFYLWRGQWVHIFNYHNMEQVANRNSYETIRMEDPTDFISPAYFVDENEEMFNMPFPTGEEIPTNAGFTLHEPTGIYIPVAYNYYLLGLADFPKYLPTTKVEEIEFCNISFKPDLATNPHFMHVF